MRKVTALLFCPSHVSPIWLRRIRFIFIMLATCGQHKQYHMSCSYHTGCPRKKSLIKFFLDDFPTDVDYGPTANFVAGHLVACQRSACYFFEGMTRSSRMLHSSAESWSVVHVRWEVVEEKFYQILFSGTPCSKYVYLC